MKYKVGDKVRIKSLDWYNENKDEFGNIDINDIFTFYADRSKYCGKVFTISEVFDDRYLVKEDNNEYYWIDEMIEGLVEEEPKLNFKVGDKVILDSYPCIVTDVHWRDSLHGFVYTVRGTDFGKIVKEDELVFDERPTPTTDEIIKNIKADWNNFKNRYNLPNEYHFVDKNGNEINISEIVLEKKKKEYPKTYEECCKVMNYCCNPVATKTTHKEELIRKFQFLLLYRDAYWKIAGEEMGLGKPWEPDWRKKRYIIYRNQDIIIGGYREAGYVVHHIFEFPTKEMRDAFKENFKELIEQCKELL